MDVETSDLPTSSRPPPAGQDSVDFKESDIENTDGTGLKEICLSKSSVLGTPRRSTCQTPCEIQKKMQSNLLDKQENKVASAPSEDRTSTQLFYESWRNGCECLVYDTEGRRVLYEYLSREKHEILLNCLEAWEVFRAIPSGNDLHISARDFYKRFLQFRDPKLEIRDQTRSKVNYCMRSNNLNTTMFDEVQQDVFSKLTTTWYARFLDSDFFLNYCLSANQYLGHEASREQQKSKGLCMPTLHEEGNTDLRLHAERHSQYGAHGKEIKGKAIKVSDGLRRPLQDIKTSRGFENEAQEIPKDYYGAQRFLVNRNPDQDNGSTLGSSTSSVAESKRERQRPREHHQDNLPTLPYFKPRTERINREAMKPMKPEDFHRILCEKLEKVVQDQAIDERCKRESEGAHMEKLREKGMTTVQPVGDITQYNSHKSDRSIPKSSGEDDRMNKSSCKSLDSYPLSDRYSVAGMSSANGSELKAESQLKYKHGAKELASAVHHALRTELKECKCQQCIEKHIGSGRPEHVVYNVQRPEGPALQSSHCSCCKHLQGQNYGSQQKNCLQVNSKLTPTNLGNYEIPADIVDHNRIYMWMEESEKFRPEMLAANVAESARPAPAVQRHHRTPVVYDTTRPGDYSSGCSDRQYFDPALQVLHQPDTNVVLEEAKKRLADNSRSTTRSSRRSGNRTSSRHHSHQGMEQVYSETAPSTTSGNWTLSDSASSVSRQQVPSVVSSSIPSSASHFLNESASDVQTESLKSRGSGSSKGHRSDATVVTYFLGLEPIPYRTSLPGKNITLSQFKPLITKKGSFRYFFKTKTRDDGIVYQQIEEDNEYLPKFENKIVVKVEKVE